MPSEKVSKLSLTETLCDVCECVSADKTEEVGGCLGGSVTVYVTVAQVYSVYIVGITTMTISRRSTNHITSHHYENVYRCLCKVQIRPILYTCPILFDPEYIPEKVFFCTFHPFHRLANICKIQRFGSGSGSTLNQQKGLLRFQEYRN
jgi:hypothetical protein